MVAVWVPTVGPPASRHRASPPRPMHGVPMACQWHAHVRTASDSRQGSPLTEPRRAPWRWNSPARPRCHVGATCEMKRSPRRSLSASAALGLHGAAPRTGKRPCVPAAPARTAVPAVPRAFRRARVRFNGSSMHFLSVDQVQATYLVVVLSAAQALSAAKPGGCGRGRR